MGQASSSETGRLESWFRWGPNGEIQVKRRSKGTIARCLYSSAAGHTKMGVRGIPITENQTIVAHKNCICLVGWRYVGWKDLWSVVGFIASRSDGWFVCLKISRLEYWMASGRLADWFVLYLVCRSVGKPSGWFAIQPATHWTATLHRPLTNQPKTLLL